MHLEVNYRIPRVPVAKIHELRASGLTRAEAAREMGVKYFTFRSWLLRGGLNDGWTGSVFSEERRNQLANHLRHIHVCHPYRGVEARRRVAAAKLSKVERWQYLNLRRDGHAVDAALAMVCENRQVQH